MEKGRHALRQLFCICFAAMALVLVLHIPAGFTDGWMIVGAILAVPMAIFAAVLCARWQTAHFGLFLFLVGVALQGVLIVLVQPPIESDFAMLFDAARQWAHGETAFQQTAYFSNWAYQSGFVGLEAMLLRIWDNPFCIRIANVLFSSGTVSILYAILRDKVRPSAARAACALCLLFPFRLFLPCVLTNQISSAFFLVLGAYLLTMRSREGKRRWPLFFLRFALAGLCLQLGNILRPEGLILLVAVAAWMLFRLLEDGQTARQRLALVLAFILMLGVYRGTFFVADTAVRQTGLSVHGLENRNPYWKFVLGLNVDSGGAYSEEDAKMFSATMTNEGVTDMTLISERLLIGERLSVGAPVLARLAWRKVGIQWASDAMGRIFGPFDTKPEIHWDETALVMLLRGGDRGVFYLALLLAAFGLFGKKEKQLRSALWLRPSQADGDGLLLYFVMFAAFCAFLVVEVQARYAYLPQLFLFAAAAFGLDRIGEERTHG